ncbi:MAG: alpha/beta hydrolase [Planctomycetota bacterium]
MNNPSSNDENESVVPDASVRPETDQSTRSKRSGTIWNKLRGVLLLIVCAYLLVLVLLAIFENSLVYPGSKYPRGDWEPAGFQFEEVLFESSDNTQLCGWYLPREDATETVLLCHGNAENAAQASQYMGDQLREKLNANVFVFDYRGYGKSEGKPNEPGVLADSEAALEWLCNRENLQPAQVIICGHSLGGGPAVHLASKSGAKALIIQQSFNSIVAAAKAQYPWVPVGWLMKNRYPSDEKIKNYDGPVFCSHGDADRVVAFECGRQLFEASTSNRKMFFRREGLGHYDPYYPEYWDALTGFLFENTSTAPDNQTGQDAD